MKKYKEIEYIVFWNNQSGSYCGYVRLPDNHPDNKKVDKKETVYLKKLLAKMKNEPEPEDEGKTFNNGYNDIDIDCHGGLTFSRRITKEDIKNKRFPQEFTEGAWIGWDYAHAGDKTNFIDGKAWTEKEVEAECKNVIEQVLAKSSRVSSRSDY